MKIMCVIGGFSFGGAERVMTNIVNYLADKHDVVFVAVHHRDVIAYEISRKAKAINGLSFSTKIGAIRKLHGLIQQEKPDVVLSFLTHINITTLFAGFGTGVPTVVSERNDPSKIAGRARRFLRKVLYPKAAGVVFQTTDAQSYFSKKIQNRSTVIPNPIFIESENLGYRPKDRKKEIVAVGRLEEQKNFPLLFQAFSAVEKQFPDYCLKVYGDGHLHREFEAIISEKGFRDKILLCGQSQTVHKDIRDASLFVLSSNYEGMPNALMEAMALGLCCISTDCPVGGPRTMIANGENGWLVPVGDAEKLAERMEYCLSHPTECEEMGEKARLLMDTLCPSAICKKWEEYLLFCSGKQASSNN